MSGRARAIGKILRVAMAGAAIGAAGMAAGCGGGRSVDGWVDASQPYAGPEVEVGRSGDMHAVRVTVPTGGWTLEGDRVELGHRSGSAYLTLRRPDPDRMQTQALEELDVVLGVPAGQGLAVYMRVVDPEQPAEGAPYRLVESALVPAPEGGTAG